jgi:hypothetical protein
MSPESTLLDQLECDCAPYLPMQAFAFRGLRSFALKSLVMMIRDRVIAMEIEGRPVEVWRIEHWRRWPDEAETERELARARLRLLDGGIERFHGVSES